MNINVKNKSYYSGTKVLDGNTYNLTFRWNVYTAKWYIDIDGVSNDISLSGIALLCGKNLLASHGHVELGQLWVVDNSGAGEDPTFDEMGGRFTVEYTPVGQ